MSEMTPAIDVGRPLPVVAPTVTRNTTVPVSRCAGCGAPLRLPCL